MSSMPNRKPPRGAPRPSQPTRKTDPTGKVIWPLEGEMVDIEFRAPSGAVDLDQLEGATLPDLLAHMDPRHVSPLLAPPRGEGARPDPSGVGLATGLDGGTGLSTGLDGGTGLAAGLDGGAAPSGATAPGFAVPGNLLLVVGIMVVALVVATMLLMR